MTRCHSLPGPAVVLALTLALIAPLAARDGGQVPARTGLQMLEDRFGRAAVRQIVEMTGTAGDPQPLEWRVTAVAPGRSDRLREFWIGDGRVTEEGLSDDFYPDRLPKGFLSLERVRLDSNQAFSATERAARDAGIGFDVINYKLHCREYTDEPVWTLTLLDREDTIVGSVHLSADTGRLLRTVWMRRQPNGRLLVEDSGRGDRPAVQPTPRLEPAPAPNGESDDPAAPVEPADPAEEPAADEPAVPSPEGDPQSPDDGEIPEIKKLQEAQEKTDPNPATPEP
jgi:hypothetical protein